MVKNTFVLFLVIVFNCCFANACIANNTITTQNQEEVNNSVKSLYGTWKITNYKWAGISSGEDAHPEKRIGTTIFFGSDRAEIIGNSCREPKYTFHHEKNAANYLIDSYRIYPEDLGIKSSNLNVVDLECAGKKNLPGTGPSASIFIITQNLIIYSTDGPYYLLEKVKK